ncbi:hypothetical protein [Sphingomonas bacterium]|uniref:hypothetical protein n=1 Tax=Sphingomonas bacterium TaxID=1895847 RepID=UPI00260261B0|nr:hypothetical protein [Sphingomonas bacterium]MDB5678519.1 hypothetical protein [Sphingomonas bacterium]
MSPAPIVEPDVDAGPVDEPPAPPPPPAAPDADWTSDPQRVIATQLALAEAMKPIEAAASDLYAPDRAAARQAVADKYAKAVAADGDVRKKIDVASDKFNRTAADMVARLDDWVKKFTSGPLYDLLEQRKKTRAALATKLGGNESARDAAVDSAKSWAARFADWSAPGDAIGKIVGGYVDQIDKLNADINNDVAADTATLSFWFDVAPKHLQVSDKALSTDAAAARDKVKKALGDAGYTDLANALDPAKARATGAVYMIPAGDLPGKRKSVLASWKDSAKTLATAQAAFKLDPDDAATLKARWDKLKDDAWLKDAKAALTATAS